MEDKYQFQIDEYFFLRRHLEFKDYMFDITWDSGEKWDSGKQWDGHVADDILYWYKGHKLLDDVFDKETLLWDNGHKWEDAKQWDSGVAVDILKFTKIPKMVDIYPLASELDDVFKFSRVFADTVYPNPVRYDSGHKWDTGLKYDMQMGDTLKVLKTFKDGKTQEITIW